jgi:hypothetical protein
MLIQYARVQKAVISRDSKFWLCSLSGNNNMSISRDNETIETMTYIDWRKGGLNRERLVYATRLLDNGGDDCCRVFVCIVQSRPWTSESDGKMEVGLTST